MSWYQQARIFFAEVRATRANKSEQETLPEEELEYVSSASEARLLTAPEGASFLIALSTILILALVAWSMFFKIDEVVKATGKVIPSKQVQMIQNLEGGILEELKVVEGEIVRKGDVLLILDNTGAESSLTEQRAAYAKIMARLQRLDAEFHDKNELVFNDELSEYPEVMNLERQLFRSGRASFTSKIEQADFEINQARAELESARANFLILKQNYIVASQEMAVNEKALEKQAISEIDYIKEKQRINELQASLKTAELTIPQLAATFHAMEKKKENIVNNYKNEILNERAESENKLMQIESRAAMLGDQVARTTVTAPVDGTINEIYINTIGGVIKPGMVIMELVPLDDVLLIEAKVNPKDIGFIQRGLDSKVKFTAFDFSKYGGLEGKVEYVSADSITDQKGNSYFQVRVRTAKTTLNDKEGGELQIIPGMQSEVNIVVDEKSILEYIMKPVLKF